MRNPVSAADLGLDLHSGGEQALFGWFLASYLFGNRISQDIAISTWRVLFDKYRINSLAALGKQSASQLVRYLGEGRYTRYDLSTAARLQDICKVFQHSGDASLGQLCERAGSRESFEKQLLALKGVGPKTLEVFMREAGPVLYGA